MPRQLVQIYPSTHLRERISAYQQQHQLSTADLVMDAIETTHEQLRTAFSAAPSALFVRRQNRRPRRGAGDTIQVGVRLNTDTITQIEDLVSTSQAPSRSTYICRAVETYLDLSLTKDDS